MKNKRFLITITVIVILLVIAVIGSNKSYSWGFYAHKKINYIAVFTLPKELFKFYKKHIVYISEHAIDADKRRHSVLNEAPKHYIDLEHYKNSIFNVPYNWKIAIEKFGEDSLLAHGIVPWQIQKTLLLLQHAFENEDEHQILKYSADLGHYLADAFVPLHTTQNYDGQLTNQKGIHMFWESRIPELKCDSFNLFTKKAKYIPNVNEFIWKIINDSYSKVDSVLLLESKLNTSFSSDKKYSYENKGKKTIRTYSVEYTNAYNQLLNNMVEKRMKEAIYSLGCLWYTAWSNAGKPALINLKTKQQTLHEEDSIDVKFKNKILHDHDF